MHDQIGSTAGMLWNVLNEKGELTVSQLRKLVRSDKAVFDWAIGWLAREDKIEITAAKRAIRIRLRHSHVYPDA